MNSLIRNILPDPLPGNVNGLVNALREIMQSLALLGLWRAKFFEHAAFYGGTSLRILYGSVCGSHLFPAIHVCRKDTCHAVS